MLKGKRIKKKDFRAKNGESVEALANRLNWLRYWLTGYTFPIEVWSRDAKKFISLLVSLHFQSKDMPSQSMTDRGPIEADGHLPSIKYSNS